MVGRALKKLAEENQMQIENGVIYGLLKGCFVSMCEGMGYKRINIYIGRQPDADASGTAEAGNLVLVDEENPVNQAADFIENRAGDFKKYRIMREGHQLPGIEAYTDIGVVAVNFFDNLGTIKCMRAFIEEILPGVSAISRFNVCAKCAEVYDGAARPVLVMDGIVVPMHEECARNFLSAQEDERYNPKERVRTGLGFLGAVLGALVGAALWAAVAIFGYMASIVGFAIAWLSAKGYDWMGGRPGWPKAVILTVCIILAVVLGNVASLMWPIHQIYQEEVAAYGAVPISEAEFMIEVARELSQDGEVMGDLIKDLGVGLLFAFLGSYGIVAASKRKEKGRSKALEGRIEA